MSLLRWCAVLASVVACTLARGISKQKPGFGWRALDSPIEEPICKEPAFSSQLPPHLYQEIHSIWEAYDGGEDCSDEITKTRHILAQLSPAKRARLVKGSKECKPPDVIKSLPDRLRERLIQIWNQREPNGNCWEQQRRTRLILLNLPPSLRRKLRPPALECSVPHFIDRLEWDLQVKLRRLWATYKRGQPCTKYVAQQLRLLRQHDISLQSFDMPPITMFRRYELIHKLKRSNKA
ncbi:hypothetical protein Y032_0313g2191 [Ancylostoma ceylanicum]|uniref:Uncharacterized protein n=1 Tax=Ancylostoma ceylanicum TaxID=53326 RepID=A0A016S2B5_9BILA|nr:hypothetical protein Y032_0313g2191 [Ancylostoma ceylanicum]